MWDPAMCCELLFLVTKVAVIAQVLDAFIFCREKSHVVCFYWRDWRFHVPSIRSSKRIVSHRACGDVIYDVISLLASRGNVVLERPSVLLSTVGYWPVVPERTQQKTRAEILIPIDVPGRTVRAPVLVCISARISMVFHGYPSRYPSMVSRTMRHGYSSVRGDIRDGTDKSTRILMVTRISLRISVRAKHGPFDPGCEHP